MKADLSRITYDATRHIRRVIRQQGRVEVEADFNEQTAAILHHLEAMMRDLVGPDAAPHPDAAGGKDGFKITVSNRDIRIGEGHYWVDGILCENDTEGGVLYTKQPDLPVEDKPAQGTHLVYLDVWERHLCADEAPWIREVALGGPDTSSRSRVVWQVKLTGEIEAGTTSAAVRKNWDKFVAKLDPPQRGALAARAVAPRGVADPCVMPPDSRYRGPENQLYRVEIHDPGVAGDGATFKWSRDNGSVVFPVRKLAGTTVQVERLSADARFSVVPGDWVEVVDDNVALLGHPGRLVEVKAVDQDELEVEVILSTGSPALPAFSPESTTHPLLRRWDQHSDAIPVEEGTWLDLEDGVQIKFAKGSGAAANVAHRYRTGDYWVIPARVATGDVEWPMDGEDPADRAPLGIYHHYAPLAIVTITGAAAAAAPAVDDARRRINKLWTEL